MFRRVSENIILQELQAKTKLHSHQFGFKRGYDTITNLLTVDAAREDGMINRTVTDYQEAYDSPSWRILQRKLAAKNLPIMLIRLISRLMFTQMFAILIVNGKQTRKVRLNRGLFQGSLLSPILFNIYIDDLLEEIHEKFVTMENRHPAIMYADDLLLMWKNAEDALNMWILMQKWNQENKMRFKMSKCSYITLGNRIPELEAIGLQHRVEYKHLGVNLTARGFDWQTHVDRTTLKAKKVMALLRSYCYTWEPDIKIQLVKAFILPITQYAIPLMVADASRALTRPLIEDCLAHGNTIRKGFLSRQWDLLNTLVEESHRFCLGLKVYPNLAIAVTAVEAASTRAVELIDD